MLGAEVTCTSHSAATVVVDVEAGTLYSFPEAAIIDYQKLDGLKQRKCIFSQFWSPEV